MVASIGKANCWNIKETNFIKSAKKLGKKSENGKKMFIHQAAQAFKIWHQIEPEITNEINEMIDKWLGLEF